jgi:glutamate-ammonia-ligase adenylyltransferase
MEAEIGAESTARLNLKQGRGGLVDVEFAAQMMALARGYQHPSLRRRSTRDLLAELEKLRLLPTDEAAALRDGYEFLTRLENRLRIESDQPAWALPTAFDAIRPLARRMGYQGADAPLHLMNELRIRREAIRAAFTSCFAREGVAPSVSA